MLSTLALAVAHGPGFGFRWWWLPLVLLFWVGIIALIFALLGRRWRRMGGPQGWQRNDSTREAESSLATRFANGDIDETEYRSRLEVLRSTRPQPGK